MTENKETPVSGAVSRDAEVDLIDLVGALFALEAEDRLLDRVIDALLAGPKVRRSVSASAMARFNWIASETPCYTTSLDAVEVLARRRGYRMTTSRSEAGYQVTVLHPTAKVSQSCTSGSHIRAGLLAITRLAILENAHVL